MSVASGWRLLTRPECHLCEDFESALHEHFTGLGEPMPALSIVDVDSRGEWRMRYGLRIPVLLDAQDRVLGEGRFDAAAFEATRRGTSPG